MQFVTQRLYYAMIATRVLDDPPDFTQKSTLAAARSGS